MITLPASGSATASPYADSKQFRDGRFENPVPRPSLGVWETAKLFWIYFNKPDGTVPDQAPPVHPLTRDDLARAPNHSAFRLGHSTILLKLDGKFWLTDPVFSERASPVSWIGPARFHRPPIAIDELPEIEAVILSHNHYDHLDRASIIELVKKTRHFLVPLGVRQQLIDWGVNPSRVREHDWWSSTVVDSVRFVATPAQHFSGRGLRDSDRSLWVSWTILADDFRVFFSGDTGYFDGFREIGDKYGPFDITFLETGAYDARWAYVHMLPEETVQAHIDLRGKHLIPIHNGTFDLALHRWDEPFRRVVDSAASRGVSIMTPRFGARIDMQMQTAVAVDHWWRPSVPRQQPAPALAAFTPGTLIPQTQSGENK